MNTITEKITFVIEHCCNCGVPFGITIEMQEYLKEKEKRFYCPNGHPQVYGNTIESQLEEERAKLRRARENETWWREQAEEKGRKLSAARGQITKIKKRVANGVCPCCDRSFTDLHRHMESKHPGYEVSE